MKEGKEERKKGTSRRIFLQVFFELTEFRLCDREPNFFKCFQFGDSGSGFLVITARNV